jgi:hypothetical protein
LPGESVARAGHVVGGEQEPGQLQARLLDASLVPVPLGEQECPGEPAASLLAISPVFEERPGKGEAVEGEVQVIQLVSDLALPGEQGESLAVAPVEGHRRGVIAQVRGLRLGAEHLAGEPATRLERRLGGEPVAAPGVGEAEQTPGPGLEPPGESLGRRADLDLLEKPQGQARPQLGRRRVPENRPPDAGEHLLDRRESAQAGLALDRSVPVRKRLREELLDEPGGAVFLLRLLARRRRIGRRLLLPEPQGRRCRGPAGGAFLQVAQQEAHGARQGAEAEPQMGGGEVTHGSALAGAARPAARHAGSVKAATSGRSR